MSATMDDFYNTYGLGKDLDLDKYTRLAVRLCDRKMSFLNILDDKNQYMISEVGVPGTKGTRMDRCDSLCHLTAQLNEGELLCIPDTYKHPLAKHFPGVSGDPHYRWYLGTPIVTQTGGTIGAFCVFDTNGDGLVLDEATKSAFLDLAKCVMNELDLRADCKVALQEKKNFMTSISHELRDPMHGIGMAVEVLSTSRGSGGEDQVALQAIKKCTTTLDGIVEQILSAYRFTNDEILSQPLVLEEVNVAKITEDILDTAWMSRLDHNGQATNTLQSILKLDKDLFNFDFIMNGRDFSRILLILFGNATKFTADGLITTTLRIIECTRTDCSLPNSRAHVCLELSVADTGCGIPASMTSRIFEEFVQVDAHKPGVGLGLSMVRRLVNSNKGSIIVESTLGQGSLFKVLLCVEPSKHASHEKHTPYHRRPMTGRSVRVSPDFDTELRSSLEEHCIANGLSLHNSDQPDLFLGKVDQEIDAIQCPIILVTTDPLRSLQTSSRALREVVCMPVGPNKLCEALLSLQVKADECAKNDVDESDSCNRTRASAQDVSLQQTALPQIGNLKIVLGQTTPPQSTPCSPGSPAVGSSALQTCLIVDDNKVNLTILSTFLKRKGYTCQVALDGSEAVTAVQARDTSQQFDLILMDINMPIMNGVEASRQIREYQKTNSLKQSLIVAVSGCSDAEQQSAMARGMNNFFKKPVNLKALSRFLETANVLAAPT